MRNPPSIAIVTPILPYPPDSGSKLRIYHLCRLMAQRGFRLFLLSVDPHSSDAMPPGMREWFEDVQILRGPDSPYAFKPMRRWKRKFWGAPFTLLPGEAEKIQMALNRWNPGFVQAEKTMGAAYLNLPLLRAKGIRCIWEEGGVHHLSYEKEANVAATRFTKLLCRRRFRRLKAFETKCLKLVDAVVAVSEEEASQLLRMQPQARVLLVPNGVDEKILSQELPPPNERDWCAFFCGNLSYLPNRDAVERYIHEIMPRLRNKGIALDFVVAGGNIPEALARHAFKNPELKLLGYVNAIDLYLKKYAIFVNPMRLGGGTRLKMLEAMAYGMACVSTKVGAEGLRIEHGKHALISDTLACLATHIEGLLLHPEQAGVLGRSARDLIAREYLWPKCAMSLLSYYEGNCEPGGDR